MAGMTQDQQHWRPNRRQFIWFAVLVIAIYAVIPQFGSFRQSFGLLCHADGTWALRAALAVAVTFGLAALTYCLVALRPLKYPRTLLVQVGSMFADRLLPAGIGGIGANYAYLRHSRHSPAQAASVVTINGLLGLSGHILLSVVVLAVSPGQFAAVDWRWHPSFKAWQYLGLLLMATVGLWLFRRYLPRVRQSLRLLLKELTGYRRRPGRLLAGLSSSLGLTFANVLALYCCAQALGGAVTLLTALVVFSIGLTLGTLTPTPGGLGGIEAGLVAGLVAVSVPLSEALAIVLLYRLISYWLSMLAGLPAFLVSLRRGYFSMPKSQRH